MSAGGTLLAVAGPTAAGKSRMAVEVARELGDVEILSCDSMAVYRGLDVLAAKPTAAERRAVPHHLLDLADTDEDFSAVRFREVARRTIAEVHERGSVPLLVGGSGLWFRAVVDDLEFAPTDPDVRRRLEAGEPDELHERLADVDPEAADRIDPRNVRRVVRALEIHELTGRPPSELRRSWERFEGPYDLTVVALTWDRDELRRRVVERIHRQLADALLEEVEGARRRGVSRTSAQALGMKEMLEHLEGRCTLEEATELFIRNAKAFVRRQLSWFRRDPRIEWVDASALGWEGARERILDGFRGALGEEGATPPSRRGRTSRP